MRCYVVRVFSGHEKKVKKVIEEGRAPFNMLESIAEVILPVEQVCEVRRGKQKVFERRIWPGYLLVRMNMDHDSWSYIKGIDGVVEFLGGETPIPLSDLEIDSLLKDLENKRENVSQKHNFSVGDRVKVVDGVFFNFVGVITEIFEDKGRLAVSLSIFGRRTIVDDLEFWQVESVADDVDTGLIS